MKRAFGTILITACIWLFSGTAWAQTVDEIIDKHLTALGGREALGKLTSRKITGDITISTPNGDIKGSIEVCAKAPNKQRTYMKLDLSSFGATEMTVDQRFDGNAGYVVNSMEGTREVTGNQLENMRNARFPTPLLNYKDAGIKVELGAKEKIGGRDVHVLVITPKAGSASRQFIDAENFNLVKMIMKAEVPQLGEIEQTTEFSDYRDVDGMKIPHRLKVSNQAQTFVVTISKIEHNAAMEDATFAKPAADK